MSKETKKFCKFFTIAKTFDQYYYITSEENNYFHYS